MDVLSSQGETKAEQLNNFGNDENKWAKENDFEIILKICYAL